MFTKIANKANSTLIGYAAHLGNATSEALNATFHMGRLWNTTKAPHWAHILRINGILTEEFVEDGNFDSGGVIYPAKKDNQMPMILILPLGGILLFLSLIALIVMFRRHPAIVMTVAASSLLAVGAYNLGLVLWTSEESAYRTTFDPRAPPKYE